MGGKFTLAAHTERALLAALMLTGFSYASVYGADKTSPLSITDKGAVVNENINVGITPGDSEFHVVNIDNRHLEELFGLTARR